MISACVVILYLVCNPTAIFGAVISAAVNAINGQVVGISVSNSPFIKGLKTAAPFIAQGYSASPISFVTWFVLFQTAFFNSVIDFIKSCLIAFGLPVGFEDFCYLLFLETTAAFCSATFQSATLHYSQTAAFALTKPSGIFMLVFCSFNNR